MDAMQKRKMWKVAISHLALTLLVFASVISLPEDFSRPMVVPLSETLSDILAQIFYYLQPICFLIGSNQKLASEIFLILSLASIPLWSLCFAWLFVKLDNWLNHFPVLGKRVF